MYQTFLNAPNSSQVPVISWFNDPEDTELLDILPFLEAVAESEDVYTVLKKHGFTQHAVRNTSYLQQQQQVGNGIITSVQQDSCDDDDDRFLVQIFQKGFCPLAVLIEITLTLNEIKAFSVEVRVFQNFLQT